MFKRREFTVEPKVIGKASNAISDRFVSHEFNKLPPNLAGTDDPSLVEHGEVLREFRRVL